MIRRMLLLVIVAIRHVLQGRRWQYAFDQNGLAEGLTHVSQFIKHQLGSDTLPDIVDACPTPAQLQLCWPRKRVFVETIVYACIPGGLEFLTILGDALAVPLAGVPAILAPPESMTSVMDVVASVAHADAPMHDPDARSSTDAAPGHAVPPPAAAGAFVPAPNHVPSRRLRTKTSSAGVE